MTPADPTTGPSIPLDDYERQRLAELAAMKRTAGLVLAAATAIFLAAHLIGGDHGVWGYVAATAEAAMVGGVADWFAVTALFRHPFGIPIPHTAIIPNRKDQLGRTLGGFVQRSFLDPTLVAARLRDADVSEHLAAWLTEPRNAASVARYAGSAAATVARLLDDDEIGGLLDEEVIARLRTVNMAPFVAQTLEVATADDRHHALVDGVLRGAANMMRTQRFTLRRRFADESPWWVPEVVDDKVFERLYAGLQTFIAEVERNPRHPLRVYVDDRIRQLVDDLQNNPETASRVAQVRDDIVDSDELREWSTATWARLRERVIELGSDADSPIQHRLTDAVVSAAHAMRRDPELAERVDRAAITASQVVLDRYGDDIAKFIESTVRNWDARETSTRLEILLGRDLQIIRINGSVVGGLTGLVLHTVTNLM